MFFNLKLISSVAESIYEISKRVEEVNSLFGCCTFCTKYEEEEG